MTSMEIQIAEGLATAQNNGIEASAKVSEMHGRSDIATRIRLLKTSAHEMLKELKSTTPEAAE